MERAHSARGRLGVVVHTVQLFREQVKGVYFAVRSPRESSSTNQARALGVHGMPRVYCNGVQDGTPDLHVVEVESDGGSFREPHLRKS